MIATLPAKFSVEFSKILKQNLFRVSTIRGRHVRVIFAAILTSFAIIHYEGLTSALNNKV